MKCGRVGLSSRAPVFQNTDLPNKKCLSVARAGCARVACVSFRFHAGKKPAKKKKPDGRPRKKEVGLRAGEIAGAEIVYKKIISSGLSLSCRRQTMTE